jgi:hydrogenase nickel incorporation protein HypA/HybF
MHELSLCESTLQIIERQAQQHNVNRVTAVWLEIGALSCVEESAIRFSFDLVCKGTVADGCKLHIITKPAKAWCWDCSKEVEVSEHAQGCPNCGGHSLRIDAGDTVQIKELEVE